MQNMNLKKVKTEFSGYLKKSIEVSEIFQCEVNVDVPCSKKQLRQKIMFKKQKD